MRLTDHDASFLYQETASGPMHGASITILEGEIPFETVHAHVQSRLHLVPRYRQRLVYVPFNLAHPKWVDDPDFDLDNHLIPHGLPAGSDLDQAIEAAMTLMEPLLPRDKPLWRTYVIDGVKDQTVLLQLGHHAMVDGASGIDISLVLYDLQADAPEPAPPQAPWQPAPLPTPLELTTEAARETAEAMFSQNPFSRTEDWNEERIEMLRRAGESMTRFVAEPVITAPWNAATVGPARKLSWQKYSFGEFREIRRAFGGTINDVVLAVVTEGAARYLDSHGEAVEGGHLRLMCPVNVRREDEHGALGNRVSAIFPIVSSRPKNVVERLDKVRFETEHIKHNREAQAMELMMEAMPSLPPVTMAQALLVGTNFDPTALAARMPAPVPPRWGPRPPLLGFNFTCTNVPGVQVEQYLAGHKVLHHLGVLMLSGTLGYGVAVGSYNQTLYFNFVCDPRLMPDLEMMAASVDEAFNELLASAREANTTDTPAAAAR
ncbi:MAG: WS/DGAT domain-containing protein [Gammaproteobacteria bacterium]|nr:WS/DGAT domain-containing protein [Gammaproteobacteria bacterium]